MSPNISLNSDPGNEHPDKVFSEVRTGRLCDPNDKLWGFGVVICVSSELSAWNLEQKERSSSPIPAPVLQSLLFLQPSYLLSMPLDFYFRFVKPELKNYLKIRAKFYFSQKRNLQMAFIAVTDINITWMTFLIKVKGDQSKLAEQSLQNKTTSSNIYDLILHGFDFFSNTENLPSFVKANDQNVTFAICHSEENWRERKPKREEPKAVMDSLQLPTLLNGVLGGANLQQR